MLINVRALVFSEAQCMIKFQFNCGVLVVSRQPSVLVRSAGELNRESALGEAILEELRSRSRFDVTVYRKLVVHPRGLCRRCKCCSEEAVAGRLPFQCKVTDASNCYGR